MTSHLERLFPGLTAAGYRVTSPATGDYNCIAWAAGDTKIWWWPLGDPLDTHWPTAAPRALTFDAFREAFASLGYVPCGGDAQEVGFEKIALFADDQGVPTHAARQLPNGRWTSKLGHAEDIEHDLRALEGDIYGTVALVMRRPSAP